MQMTMQSRGLNGRFTSCLATASRKHSLKRKKDRQKAYLLRRARERKRISSTFLTAFAVKGQNKAEHWIPGSKTDSLLFRCMESLITDRFLESRRSRLAVAKRIYFRGHPNSSRKRLPRVCACDANRLENQKERVSAFVGWRFPNPIDTVEMDGVDSWLKRYEQKLKLGIEDARRLCFNLFSSYKKLPDRDENYSERGPYIPDSEEMRIQQDVLIKGYKEMMNVATKTDFFYRSLLLVLNPSCEVRLDVLCAAWMQQFAERAPSEDWCGLLKDIFEYCRLVEQRDVTNASFVQLREDLANQLSMFKLIRLSAGLPLFDGSSSLIDQVFLRSRSI